MDFIIKFYKIKIIKPKKSKKTKKKEAEPAKPTVDELKTQQQQPVQANNTGSIDLFGDIFGGGNTAPSTNPNPSNSSGGNDIFSLLGNMGSSNSNANTGATQGNMVDLNSILSGNAQPQQNAGGGMNLDFMGMGGQPQQSNVPPNLKEVFKNNDITIFSSLNQNNNEYSGSFYITNNTSSQINDVVVNFLVKKYISCQVHSTSGKDLPPNSSLGIRKDVTMINKDPNKGCIIKMSINYNKDGNTVSDSKVVTL